MIDPIIHLDRLKLVMILSNIELIVFFFNDRSHRSIFNVIKVNIKISYMFLIKFFFKKSTFSNGHFYCYSHINIFYNFLDFVSHSNIDYDLLYITTTVVLLYLDGLLFRFAIINLHGQM